MISEELPKRVLFIGPQPPQTGGSFAVAGALVNGMAELGVEYHVITPPWSGSESYDAVARRRGVIIHRLDRPVVGSKSPPTTEELERICGLVRTILDGERSSGKEFDISVLGHDSFAWYAPLLKEYGLPVVQHLGGTPTRAIFDGIYDMENTKKFLDALVLADHYVSVGNHFKTQLGAERSEFGFPGIAPERITVIGDGVDTDLFKPRSLDEELLRKLDLPENARVLLHVSAFAGVKRIEDIVASAEHVVAEEPNAFYVIVGPEPDSCYASLAGSIHVQRLVEASPVKNHFRLPGLVPNIELPHYYGLVSNTRGAFIVASDSEGFSLTAIEAQASGSYLIMSDCPAGLERTLHGTIGRNYRRNPNYLAPSELAQATLEVLRLPEEAYRSVTDAARQHVVDTFSMRKWLNTYKQYLAGVLRL